MTVRVKPNQLSSLLVLASQEETWPYPLFFAPPPTMPQVERGDEGLVRLLLAKGARPNGPDLVHGKVRGARHTRTRNALISRSLDASRTLAMVHVGCSSMHTSSCATWCSGAWLYEFPTLKFPVMVV